MALEFAVFERNEESTLKALGKVGNLVGKEGKLSLIPKNFKDKGKRVVVILEKKDGTSAQVTCSQQVSDGLRNGTIKLGHILNFEIMEGEAGVPYISVPGGLMTFAVKSIKAENFTPSTVTTEEELVAMLKEA